MTTDKLAAGGQVEVEGLQGLIANWRKWADKVVSSAPSFTLQAAAWRQCAYELEKFIEWRRAGEGSQAAPQPFGYAYRYADGIRFDTGGREINGSMPIEVIPLYRAAAAGSGTFAEGIEAAAKHRPMSYRVNARDFIRCECGAKFYHEDNEEIGFLAWEEHIRKLAQEKREPAPDKSGEK